MSAMMTTCGICGKRFVVTWPQHWVYRRKDVYLCGEDCMIVYDTQCTRAANGFGAKKKEGADENMALTQKQKNEAVEIAIQGGSPIEYLKKCGLKNPYCAWGCIKKNLEKNDPGKYVKLISMSADKPAKVEKVNKVPEPMQCVAHGAQQTCSSRRGDRPSARMFRISCSIRRR